VGAISSGFISSPHAFAADPQPYTVNIEPTGLEELDDLLPDSLLLVALREVAPVPPFGLIARARGDVLRVTTALNSFGFYQPHVAIKIAGRDLNDLDLLELLDRTAPGDAVTVDLEIATGPIYRLGSISTEGEAPPEVLSALGLSTGQPALAADIANARTRLLRGLQEDGYAFAEVQEPVATADDQAHVLDVAFAVRSGPRVEIGTIAFQGLEAANESFLRDALTVHSGDPYKPSAIESARTALVATGIFSGVSVRADDRPAPDGRIPLTFDVRERPLHAVKLDGTYSTDLGVSLSAGWLHRNLLGNGEQLNFVAAGTGLWGNATDDIGYRLSAQFIKPVFLRRDQALQFDLSAMKQSLQAYNQRAETVAATLRRRFLQSWTATAGIAAAHDRIVQKSIDRTYQLLSLPVTASYDNTGVSDPLQDPLHGLRASLAVTPTQAFGAENVAFVIVQASSSAYFDLSGDGRSVLAMRGLAGGVWGASNLDLPPDQRLYAGGSPTVRGYRYQSIGPLFPDGDPIGGTAIDAAGIEFRQRLFGKFGAVAFVDAGQANADGVPFAGTVRVGAGGGLRYYTPIGAVRVDAAVPLTRLPNGDRFEIYIGLGQAF